MMTAVQTEQRPVVAHSTETFLTDVVTGLSMFPKTLPCKYFYDACGSALFDNICELPEYYPTRTEAGIMQVHAADMAKLIGDGAILVEYGSGSSTKTRYLLDQTNNLSTYVPIDISHEHLNCTADILRSAYPAIDVLPVSADYTLPITLPEKIGEGRLVIYFPGSTIGNFHPDEARTMLTSMAALCGTGGGLLIGIDLVKDLDVLEAAYNDSAGVTAEFNRNLIRRINDELGGNFNLTRFQHKAFFNRQSSRIEMHLVSDRNQEVWVGNRMFKFAAGESIWTESSYKYSLSAFADLAQSAGWHFETVWSDPQEWFSVQYLTVSN